MKTRTLAILSILAVALLAAGVMMYTRRNQEYAAVPAALYPTLESRIADIRAIRVNGPKGEFHIDFDGDTWRLREKSGYPIRTERIRAAALTLSNLKVFQPKTSKPENYPLLGVQDAGGESPSIFIEMQDEQGQAIVSIVLGTIEPGMTPDVSRRYVRKTDDPQVYFIEGRAAVEPNPMRWIDKEILRVTRAWTHDLVITHPDGEVVRVFRPDIDARDFSLDNVSPGAEFIDERDINLIGNSFIYIGMEDVASMEGIQAESITTGPIATVRTFDGFQMTAHLFDFEGQTWVTFEAAALEPLVDVEAQNKVILEKGTYTVGMRTPEQIQTEVDGYNNRLEGYRFRMTESKTGLLSFRMSGLLRSPGAPAAGDEETDESAGPPSEPPPHGG